MAESVLLTGVIVVIAEPIHHESGEEAKIQQDGREGLFAKVEGGEWN